MTDERLRSWYSGLDTECLSFGNSPRKAVPHSDGLGGGVCMCVCM